MKALSIIFLSVILFIQIYSETDSEFKTENDVLILNESNFDKALNSNPYLMVLFYAPWCGHCQRLHPEYEKAAKTLLKDGYHLAKVDSTVEKNLSKKYKIDGYPTVLFFVKGEEPVEYEGGRQENDIVTYFKANVVPLSFVTPLTTVKDVEKCIKKDELCIIYFGRTNETKYEYYKNVAENLTQFPFYQIDDPDLVDRYSENNKTEIMIIFKHFDGKRNILRNLDEISIYDFVQDYALPSVGKLDRKTGRIILMDKVPGLVLFADKNLSSYAEYEKLLNKLLTEKKLYKKVKLVISDIEEGFPAGTAEFMDITKDQLPALGILDATNRRKYRMFNQEINEANILKFVSDWENHLIKPYYRSEPIPEKNDTELVMKVVSKNFEKEVIDNDKDVFIMFYSSKTCRSCLVFSTLIEEMSRRIKDKNPNLIIAKIDGSKNDVEGQNIDYYPVLKIFPGKKKKEKENSVIYYDGENIKYMINFIKQNGDYPLVYEDEEEKKKEEQKKAEDKKDEEKNNTKVSDL